MTILLPTIQRRAWFYGECILISHKWVLYFRTSFTCIRLVFPRIISTQLFSHFMQITQPSTSHVSLPFWQCVIFCVSVSYFASVCHILRHSYECFVSCVFLQHLVRFLSRGIFTFIFPVLYVSAFLSFFCFLGIYFFITCELKSS